MRDVSERSIEVPGAVVLMAQYGAALFVANQLQYWCARIHADTFDDVRHGSAIRAEEKFRDALKGTFGKVKDALTGRVPRELHEDLIVAVDVRNYIAHMLPWDTRGLVGDELSLEELAARLRVWVTWFGGMCVRAEAHYATLLRARGVSEDIIEKGMAPWNELGAPEPLEDVTPGAHVHVVRARWARFGPIGTVLFETDTGEVLTFADNGLAFDRARGPRSLSPWHDGAGHFPATIATRPTKKSGLYRGSFDYDLTLSTGVIFRCEPARSGAGFSIEIIAPPAGKRGRKEGT